MDKNKESIAIGQLEEIMISHGAVIRAIPREITQVLEKRHADEYPNGEICYLDKYKREMLVVKEIPKHAGKFIVQEARHTCSMIDFQKPVFFDSIADVARYLIEKDRLS